MSYVYKAFPSEGYNNGMDLRDYFAAKAMQAIIARFPQGRGGWEEGRVASSAYYMADAMLKAKSHEEDL